MTDWELIRDMMAAAIDACESDRDAAVSVRGAWTYPENIRYAIIRERHEKADDRAYVPEASRTLVAMAHAAAEIIGSGQPKAPAADDIRKMITWFGSHAVPGVE
ncbi:hypothetical protein [Rhizobium yanglingense]